jgi:hypothetical protein
LRAGLSISLGTSYSEINARQNDDELSHLRVIQSPYHIEVANVGVSNTELSYQSHIKTLLWPTVPPASTTHVTTYLFLSASPLLSSQFLNRVSDSETGREVLILQRHNYTIYSIQKPSNLRHRYTEPHETGKVPHSLKSYHLCTFRHRTSICNHRVITHLHEPLLLCHSTLI